MRLSRLLPLFAFAFITSPPAVGQIESAEVIAPSARPVPSSQVRATGTADLSALPDFQGTIEDSDLLQNGKPYDAYSVPVAASSEVTVTMNSSDFDTYLIVRAPSGREWTNDDFDGTSVSQVSFIAAEAGEYTVWATTYRASGRGAYEVRVTSKRATIVSEVSGRLDYEDDQLIKGEFVDVVTVRAPDRGEFFVELLPLGFNGFVRVTSPGGVSTRGESSGERGAIRVGPLRGERGSWAVDVTTGVPGEVGAYDLRVITLDEQ